MSFIENIREKVVKTLDYQAKSKFEVNKGKLRRMPNTVICLVYIMCLSVLIQGVADVAIKIGGYASLVTKFHWRVDFLFLTALSVLMGYQVLLGMRRRELDVTRNSVQTGILVETALVVGDIYFVVKYSHLYPDALAIRAPFIVLTTINIFIFLYIIKRLELFKDQTGHWSFF